MTIPILIIGYNRPEFIRRRLLELSKSSSIPDKVIISLDGSGQQQLILPPPDWAIDEIFLESLPFDVKIIRRSENLGCSKHIILAVSEVLAEYRSCIIIEDDVVIGKSFVGAMKRGFLIMEHSEKLGIVGGFSPFYRSLFPFLRGNSWRLSPYFSAWGWGATSELWEKFVSFSDIASVEEELSHSQFWIKLSKRKQKIWLERFDRGVWDYNVQYILFLNSLRVLLPTFRLIDNEGFSDLRSTHTKLKRPWNLFGEGYCQIGPDDLKWISNGFPFKLFWSFVDSNLWAADGYFNARARKVGVRSFLKQMLRSFRRIIARV